MSEPYTRRPVILLAGLRRLMIVTLRGRLASAYNTCNEEPLIVLLTTLLSCVVRR
jgi:hypothetical protein